jgi:type II restriction/modification system DNA methylase subunit YeeA
MVALVERMLDLHQQLAAASGKQAQRTLQSLIESTDREIDALVYELYGLTDDEIAIVEGR